MPDTFLEPFNVAVVLAALVAAFKAYFYFSRRRNGLPHPPGVKGWPVIGHLKMPDGPLWEVYRQWSELYGPFI